MHKDAQDLIEELLALIKKGKEGSAPSVYILEDIESVLLHKKIKAELLHKNKS